MYGQQTTMIPSPLKQPVIFFNMDTALMSGILVHGTDSFTCPQKCSTMMQSREVLGCIPTDIFDVGLWARPYHIFPKWEPKMSGLNPISVMLLDPGSKLPHVGSLDLGMLYQKA